MQIVAKSGWVEMMNPLMPCVRRQEDGLYPGGRQPDITLTATLTACLLLAMMERPILIRDVWRLLASGIDAGTRKHLGLDPKQQITERMVSYSFGLIAAALNPSVHAESNAQLLDENFARAALGVAEDAELDPLDHATFVHDILEEKELRLDEFVRKGLAATHPKDAGHEGDYILDGTYVSSWEAPFRTRRRLNFTDKNGVTKRRMPRAHEMSDPDATWWSKGGDQSGLGYLVSAVVWMEKDCGVNVRGADIPYLIEHFSVKTAKANGQQAGAEVIEAMIAHHEKEDSAAGLPDRVRADITADREYSISKDWQRRMHIVGLTPHFLLTKNQLGHTSTLASGAIIVDGIPYSPGMPNHLRQSFAPIMFATRDDRANVAAWNLQRAPYRLRANGGARQDDGSLKLYCPASNLAKAAISCDNKPASKAGKPNRIQIGTALPVIMNSPKPAICAQSTATISFDEAPYWQPYIPGTPEHQWSVNRRNLVESAFSRIKDEATQSVRRGTFRVMGRAKVSLMVLFNAMAANLIEVERWQLRKAGVYSLDVARQMKVRTPRRHTRARIAAAHRRAKAAQEREAKLALQEMGIDVDLETGEIVGTWDPPKG
jgi:hypothetical protein